MSDRPPCPTCKGRLLPMASHIIGWHCLDCGAEWQDGRDRQSMPTHGDVDSISKRGRGLPFKMKVLANGEATFQVSTGKHRLEWILSAEQVKYLVHATCIIRNGQMDQARVLRNGYAFQFGNDDGKRWARMDDQRLALEQTSVIKPRPCASCRVELRRGAPVFKAVKSDRAWDWPYGKVNWRDARFCLACVDSEPVGVPIRHLRVIDGTGS